MSGAGTGAKLASGASAVKESAALAASTQKHRSVITGIHLLVAAWQRKPSTTFDAIGRNVNSEARLIQTQAHYTNM